MEFRKVGNNLARKKNKEWKIAFIMRKIKFRILI